MSHQTGAGNSRRLLTECRGQRGERRHDAHRLDAHGDDLADEADDVLRVVGAVGIAGDAAAGVGGDAVLVEHPIERGAVAEAVVERLRRHARQRQVRVDDHGGLVFGEFRLLHMGERLQRRALDGDGAGEREFRRRLVRQVEVRRPPALPTNAG